MSHTTPWRNFHVTVTLAYMLRASDDDLSELLSDRETGHSVSPAEAKALATELQARGFTYLPVCDNAGADGRCQGHDIEA
ncbi:hypothetical protein [Noviherbaspirillum pedocola]|uniref:Uncharacterized protein n=1 Tax=Noviherbaspirillum pedocola TaxID=2801341 RepID=A0A934SSU7_9BURK|nr:hypothetical protein [Noviherbaspirillum pedocola]MBK4735960.1 hypothetical protein [Noviherbaspirillum pedocola]